MASVTTDRETRLTDRACRPNVGDHKFIRHQSFVTYRNAQLLHVEQITAGLESGILTLDLTLNEAVIRRVITGALESNQTPRGVKRFVEENRE